MYDARKRARNSPQIMFQNCNRAFHAGNKAKRMQLSRTSIFYGDNLVDQFFFAGYDGEVWEEAVKRLIAGKKPEAATAQA
jgi:hypothetical protein